MYRRHEKGTSHFKGVCSKDSISIFKRYICLRNYINFLNTLETVMTVYPRLLSPTPLQLMFQYHAISLISTDLCHSFELHLEHIARNAGEVTIPNWSTMTRPVQCVPSVLRNVVLSEQVLEQWRPTQCVLVLCAAVDSFILNWHWVHCWRVDIAALERASVRVSLDANTERLASPDVASVRHLVAIPGIQIYSGEGAVVFADDSVASVA